MAVFIRLDAADLEALLAWVRRQIADVEAESDGVSDVCAAASAMVDVVAADLHSHTPAGRLARSTLQNAALTMRNRAGYDETWDPTW